MSAPLRQAPVPADIWGLGLRASDSTFKGSGLKGFGYTWAPKVCKIIAFMAIIRGSGLWFYIFLGLR